MIIPFYNGIFSQWHKSKFTINNIEYNCCEQYMMSEKALLFNDNESNVKIMETNDPRTQKALGRKVKNYDQNIWEKHRFDIVVRGNYAKFSQNEKLKDALLYTNDNILCEASPYDKIWGIGLSKTHPDVYNKNKWKGTNLLGEALMKVRKIV